MPTTPIDDVLDHILQNCSISSLAVISRVSFHTRELALPHLLRRVYLDYNPQQILTFLNFIIDSDNAHDSDLGIISEPGRRVFELGLDMFAMKTYVVGDFEPVRNQEHPISTWAHMLTKALSLMPNLRSFTLGETEEIVTYSPDFGPTLLNLPHLTSLILCHIGRNTSLSFGKAIDTLKGVTKLEALHLSATSGERGMKVVAHEGVGRFLAHYSVHWTDLYLSGLDLRTLLQEDEHRPDNSRVAFPAVGKLEIVHCELSLEGLANAFPALHTLEFLCPRSWHGPRGPRQNQVSFPNLISIKGPYWDIYTILNSNASRDHVRRAVITSDWDDDSVAPYAYAVPKAAPCLKSLHFHSDVRPLAWWQGVGKTLPELTYLDIELCAQNGLDLICNHIPSAIAKIPLEYISLLLKGYPFLDNPDIHITAEEALAIALSYAKDIPTLKYIDICRATHTRYPEAPVTWWKIVREVVSDGKVSLHVESLDAAKGRALREWYDLQAYGGIVV